MRQVWIKAPKERDPEILELARQFEGENLAQWPSDRPDTGYSITLAHLPNRKVGDLLAALKEVEDTETTLSPHSVFPLLAPDQEVAQAIHNVQPRSPVEIWLNSLQSVGSWQGLLGYTAAAGIVVWIAMFTNTIFLTVAAMLIAPFAGPAMNAAVATATGDLEHLRRNIVRYFVSLGTLITVTFFLSVVFGLENATNLMVDSSQVAAVAVLLPLVTGAAGALNLVQADNSSLVPGTAVGLLVAASLAPPAGLIGMSLAIQRWDLAFNGAFLLVLQLAAINLAGSFLFRVFGVNTSGSRYRRGKRAIFYLSIGVTAAALAGLLLFQFSSRPMLQRNTRAAVALEDIRQVVENHELVNLVEASARFTRPAASQGRPEALLGVVYVERKPEVDLPAPFLADRVSAEIQDYLLDQDYNVVPLISVTVLEPPPEGGEGDKQ